MLLIFEQKVPILLMLLISYIGSYLNVATLSHKPKMVEQLNSINIEGT